MNITSGYAAGDEVIVTAPSHFEPGETTRIIKVGDANDLATPDEHGFAVIPPAGLLDDVVLYWTAGPVGLYGQSNSQEFGPFHDYELIRV